MLRLEFTEQIIEELRFILTSVDNMEHIKLKHGKDFIGALKSNRLVALTEEDRAKGRFVRIDQIECPEQEAITGWLKGLSFPVRLARQVFTNKDDRHSVSGLQSIGSGLGHHHDNPSKTLESRGLPQVIEIHCRISQVSGKARQYPS